MNVPISTNVQFAPPCHTDSPRSHRSKFDSDVCGVFPKGGDGEIVKWPKELDGAVF